eukprot:1865940-Pyramimonas_sp.AAC.1
MVKLWNATSAIVHNIFAVNAPEAMGETGLSSINLAQADSDMQHVNWETLLAAPADNPAAAVNFTAAWHLSAS